MKAAVFRLWGEAFVSGGSLAQWRQPARLRVSIQPRPRQEDQAVTEADFKAMPNMPLKLTRSPLRWLPSSRRRTGALAA